eukprot:9329097-Karenia_brevis.AAC.1
MAIIPLVKFCQKNVDMIQKYVNQRVPQWRSVPIVSRAVYLGFMTGPTAAEVMWDDALVGWEKATATIIDSQ